MLNLVCMGFSMIDQTMIDVISSYLEVGDLSNELAQELLDNYIKLVEQNAELHKENEKNKSDANNLYELCADIGVCPEYLRVNFAN
mgnify:CR=1 FL=1|tara:strand:+ start:411 stop:668 length:258 start_codon:yes stop_codon:yes gene_type:complete